MRWIILDVLIISFLQLYSNYNVSTSLLRKVMVIQRSLSPFTEAKEFEDIRSCVLQALIYIERAQNCTGSSKTNLKVKQTPYSIFRFKRKPIFRWIVTFMNAHEKNRETYRIEQEEWKYVKELSADMTGGKKNMSTRQTEIGRNRLPNRKFWKAVVVYWRK